MPTLPTLTVTDAQAARIQNTFPGATQAERVEAYKAWLRQAIRDHVVLSERDRLRSEHDADVQASDAAVDTELAGI